MDSLTVLDHPVLSHKLAILRDENTRSPEFRKTLLEIGHIMSWPVFSHFSVAKKEITTPMENTTQNVLTSPYPCIVSILRAGNGMADSLSATLPEAPIGYIGMQRNENTHLAEPYFKKLPDQIQNRQIKQLYRDRYPEDLTLRNLQNWAELEKDNSQIFEGMYQFWCQKKQ